jgi:hypothetical protein
VYKFLSPPNTDRRKQWSQSNRISMTINFHSQSQSQGGLRRKYSAASLLGLRVRIPPEAWIIACCWMLCVVMWRSLRWADRSYRGVLPTVVCLSIIVKARWWGGPVWRGGGGGINHNRVNFITHLLRFYEAISTYKSIPILVIHKNYFIFLTV